MASAKVASALKALLPAELPPTLSSRAGTLYSVLARHPQDGVGQRVHQTRWSMKDIDDCYWEVTRTKLKLEGTHGKAWGKLVWKGRVVSPREERIPGGLKYAWRQGASRGRPQASEPPQTSTSS